MATSKKKVPPSPSKKTPTPAEAPPEDASRAAVVLNELQARWPALNLVEADAFRALLPDAKADELGPRTRALPVRDEAIRWARTIDSALRTYPSALEAYSPKRFAWFLRCVRQLDDEIAAQQGKRSKVGSVRGTSETAYSVALTARHDLARRLRTFAGVRDAERAALSAALGQTDTAEQLAISLRSLAALGNDWLARKDEAAQIQAEAARLTKPALDAALAQAKGLVASSATAVIEGNHPGGDSPPVNRAEGRVLWEMREARRIFAEARETNQVVPKLSPGPAVRSVIGTRRSPGSSAQDDALDDDDLEPPPAESKKPA